jgi:hypothetical protein
MRRHPNWQIPLAVAAVLLLAFAAVASAQVRTGNLHGMVVDTTTGAPLPGVTVTISGVGPTLHQVTDAGGSFRFPGLAPGAYRVEARLDGFSPVVFEAATVRLGATTSIELRMNPAIEETITVTAESPLLDERRVMTGATVTQVELEKIPTARDPWAVMQGVPGVLMDRVNVGGIEAGEQSNFVGPGSDRQQAQWAIDGVIVTDPGAVGASPTYYDFENMEEMQFGTGGSEISALTGGVQINLVTRRGTNEWRGSARFFRTDDSWASEPSISDSKLGQPGPWNANNPQPEVRRGNVVDQIDEYGFEVGGPIVRDRFWLWGSYSFADVTKFALGRPGELIPDDTELENISAKLNWQATPSTSAVGFYHFGDKVKSGRNAGPTRTLPTTWNQSGPTDIYKLEATHVFGANLFTTAMASIVDGGFALTPQSGIGPNVPDAVNDAGGVWHNSFLHYETDRPQTNARVDGNYFFQSGDVSHELRFGVGYRFAEVDSLSFWQGNEFIALQDIFGPGVGLVIATQPWVFSALEFEAWEVFAQDTLSWGRLTANVGLRWDYQDPLNKPATVRASTFQWEGAPILEAISRPEVDPGFDWSTISPRLGLTYALGADRRTLARASFSQFQTQMSAGEFSFLGPNINGREAYFFWYHGPTPAPPQPGELELWFIDPPRDPSFVANTVDPNLRPTRTDEVILALEHALLPEFVVGASVTWREENNMLVSSRYVVDGGVRRIHQVGDYVLNGHIVTTLPDGTSVTEPVFRLRPDLALDPQRGVHRRNSDTGREYMGVTLSFNKRLSNRWMARGHFTWNDWTWDIPSHERQDPTRFVNAQDGDQVLVQSAGSGLRSEVWINSRWQLNIAGMYQVAPDRPWGFNIAGDLFGRQGFAVPYRLTTTNVHTQDFISRTVLLAPSNTSFRSDDIYNLSLRVEKPFDFGDWGVTVGVDAFNVLNTNVPIQRGGLVAGTYVPVDGRDPIAIPGSQGDWVRETVAPRIFRIGARITYR